jgi:hypothetical protein
LWPTWERTTLPDTTAELIDGDRAFLRAVLACWLDPATQDLDEVGRARARARVARTNIEAAVQRALDEPTGGRTGLRTRQATGVLASLRRLADGALSLEAYLEDGVSPAPSEARALAEQLDAALAELARAAREHRAPGSLPPLRETQQAVSARVGAAAPLAEETDLIVNSVVIAADVLSRHEPSGEPRRRWERIGPSRVA